MRLGLETGDSVDRCRERDPVAALDSREAEPDRQVGPAGAGRAQQDNIAGLVEEHAGGQVRDDVAAQTELVVEVEVLEAAAARDPACQIRISAPRDVPGTPRNSASRRQPGRRAGWRGPGSGMLGARSRGG